MKTFQKITVLAMSLLLVLSVSTVGMIAAADSETSVEAARWFPAKMDRNNGYDDLWEVVAGENFFQSFNQQEEDPAAPDPWLDIAFSDDGALTVTRNGKDGKGDIFWPKVRTIQSDNMPTIELTTSNMLYYDFTATEGWVIDLIFPGFFELRLNKAICAAAGTATLATSDDDGVPGTYKGSIDVVQAIKDIAENTADGHATEMQVLLKALNKSGKISLPEMDIFVVGKVGASVTVNSMYLTSADDPNGDKCSFVDMQFIYEDYYDNTDNGDEKETPAVSNETDDGDQNTTETKANDSQKDTDGAKAGDFPWWIVIAGGAVVVAVVIVVIIVTKNKGKNPQQ